MRTSRGELLDKALRDLEKRFPQFRKADYRPNEEESEAYRQYQLLKENAGKEAIAEAFLLFDQKQRKDSKETDQILVKMGLVPLPEAVQNPATAGHPTERQLNENDATESPKRPPDQLTHSPDYRSVSLRGKSYSLTSRQAQVIEILHKAYETGNPEVSCHYILEQLGTRSSRLWDTFKSNHDARRALIRPGDRRGSCRLHL